MKEMVGGCCVCSDERGWPENPLVYCDGQSCTVAVHQACYGIVTVPTGPWFCRKCESQERAARVRCELCPSRDGALKKTDNQGWAHVVCALYIPEVRFGNVTTMEPIILQLIPQERYSKTCYICQEIGKGSKAHVGACMQCNKSGCKQQFHVTCAQALGLLCEEAGNYLDNVKYCGYCQHHYSKLKKGGNVKTIPPYKPVTNETASSDPPSSPEKESEILPASHHNTSSTSASLKSIIHTTNNSLNSSAAATITSSSTASSSSSSKPRKSGGNSKANNSGHGGQSTTTSSSSSSSSATSNSTTSTITLNSSGNNNNNNNNSFIVLNTSGGGSTSGNSNNSSNSHSSNLNNNNVSSNTSGASGGGNSSSTSSRPTAGSVKEKDSKSSKNLSKISSSSKVHEKVTKGSKVSSKDSGGSSSSSNNTSMDYSSSITPPVIVPSTLTNPSSNTANGSNSSSNAFKESLGQKFTTSNFTETIVVNSESVFGSENIKGSSGSSSGSSGTTSITTVSVAKKRKFEAAKSVTSSSSLSADDNNRDLIKDVSVTLVPLPLDRTNESLLEDKTKKQKTVDLSLMIQSQNTIEPNSQNVSPNLPIPHTTSTTSSASSSSTTSISAIPHHNKQQTINATIVSNLSSSSNQSTIHASSSSNAPSLVVSVPLSTATIPGINLPPHTNPSLSSNINNINNNYHNLNIQQQQQQIPEKNTSLQQQQQQQQLPSPIVNVQQQNTHRHSPLISNNNNPIHNHHQQQQHHHHPQQQPLQSTLPLSVSTPTNLSSLPTVVTHASSHNDHYAPTPSQHILATVVHNKSIDSKESMIGGGSVLMSSGGGGVGGGDDMSSSGGSGGLKFSFEKQVNTRVVQLQDDASTGRRSRTPENFNSVSSFGGLKFGFESQSGSGGIISSDVGGGGSTLALSATPQVGGGQLIPAASSATGTTTVTTGTPASIKDSPPSSPSSEASLRKRNRQSTDTKDFKIFQNGVHVTHMLGNQLNPASSVAQKMSDQLHMELEAHSLYTATSLDSGTQIVGPPFPGRQNQQRNTTGQSTTTTTGGTQQPQQQQQQAPSLASMLGGNGIATAAGNTPQSLEQLLERQWEQGSQFLMEQAQHFDIASLLSCLHQLRTENIRLEEHVTNLVARRDHLLAVNARLAIPLSPAVQQQHSQAPFNNNIHINGGADVTSIPPARLQQQQQSQQQQQITGRSASSQHNFNLQQQQQQQQQQQPTENGIDFRQTQIHQTTGGGSTSITTRQSSISSNYPNQIHAAAISRQQQITVSNNPDSPRIRSFGVAGGGGGVGGSGSQSSYSNTVHQQLRPDEIQPKPS